MTAAALAASPKTFLDRFARVRDRELFDLIDALEAALDLIACVAVTSGKLSERHGENICATLDEAITVLRELREQRP